MSNLKMGIWLDFRSANLISLKGGVSTIETIESEIDTSQAKGGSPSKTPYGATDTVSEKHYLERRKREEKAYYARIMKAAVKADEVFLFGPAEAKDGLLKAIKGDNNFRPAFKGIETADSMTDNQKVARVREFFESN